jgi:hypothetical protein
VMEEADWKSRYPAAFIEGINAKGYDEFDVVIDVRSQDTFRFISSALSKRFQPEQYLSIVSEQGGYILLNGTSKDALYSEKYKNLNSLGIGFTEQDKILSSKLFYINLGLLPEKVKLIEAAGMQIIPRTAGYAGWNDWKFAKAVLEDYKQLKTVPTYALFSGEETIGFDEGTAFIVDYLKTNGVTVGLIENTTQLQNIMQEGLVDIVIKTDYKAVRVFTVWGYIQNRYQYYGYESSEEIENTLFRAVVERNIRILYFKPMKEFKDNHTYITDIDEYKKLFNNVESRIAEHNFTVGQASVMKPYDPGRLANILLGLGCAAAAVLLIKTILPIGRKTKAILFTLSVFAVLGANLLRPDLAGLITSFAAAVIFACLATIYIMKQSKYYAGVIDKNEKLMTIINKGILVLTGGVAISILGGILTAAPISNIGHMLELDIFRGVKLAQILPLVFFPLAYLAYFGYGSMKKKPGELEFGDLKDMMNSSIKIWMVIIGMAGAAVGVYYILRTGHDSELMPSTFEMLLRNTLEQDLIARPRTKEFLFAFPAILMLVYTSIRQFKIWPIIFGLASVIGLTSVINTFMHIRTPLYLGLARTGYSWSLGILIGILGILLFEGIYLLYKKKKGSVLPDA